MAKVTKEKIIGDIELQLTQSAPSQDLEVENRQIAFWVTQQLNYLKAQEIEQLLRQGKQVPQLYIVRQACNALTEESTGCVDPGEDGENDRMWFELDQEVLDVKDDNGIIQVLTDELEEIFKQSLQMMPMFQNMRYTKTSSQLLAWHRQADLIYISGFKTSDLDFNKIIVYYVPKQDVVAMEATDEITISDNLLPVLIERVVEIGKLELYGTQADVTNDANQNITPVYHRQIQSPEQPQPEQ